MVNKDDNGIRQNTSRNTHDVVAALLFEEEKIHTVLDIPCGEGSFTKRLLDRGLEVKPADCVDLLKVDGVQADICDMNHTLPYEAKSLDSVVCIDGIEHVERAFDFVKECSRIIRDDGIFLISTPNITALRSRWRWFLTGFHNKCKGPLDESNPTPLHHISMLSFPELRYMLHTNGFVITSVKTNRVKLAGWLYAPWAPIVYLVTLRTFLREEKNADQRKRNAEILRQMFSTPVLFGETLIVKARKE